MREIPVERIIGSLDRAAPGLLEIVNAHGYDLAQRRGELVPPEVVAADWYEPGVAALRREDLPEIYASKTDADLFLWIYQRRRALRAHAAQADFDAAAQDARTTKVSRRFRRALLRGKTTPLRRRT